MTLAPLAWLVSVTFTASYHKILDPNPRIGFLAHAQQLAEKAAGNPTHTVSQLIFNDRLDASVTGVLVILVALILIESTTLWIKILSGRSEARAKETPFVLSRWVAEEQP